MRIAVVGQGRVGLVAVACLAEAGHHVMGVESDARRLESLREGTTPFYEPGLQELLHGMRRSDLTFHSSLTELPVSPQGVIIAVGTPQLPSGGADLRQLASAILDISAMSPLPDLVLVKSTIPPGTSERLLAEANGLRERYVYSPEFLSEGSALAGWRNPARIVLGLRNKALLPLAHEVHRQIESRWIVTSPTNAEMIKYASNAFLATKVSFVNEIANLCAEVGATIDDVVDGIGADPRIGEAFLRAGVGYGGSCFPKDTQALVHLSGMTGRSMPLLEAVITVNRSQRRQVVRLIQEHLGVNRKAPVAVLGLTYKPQTDDLREAPSLVIVPELVALGLPVRIWDPAAPDEQVKGQFPGADRASTIEEAVNGTAAVLILTDWAQVVEADWEALGGRMIEPRVIVDGRHCLVPERLGGIRYVGIGRG